jgi:hypothetical protein
MTLAPSTIEYPHQVWAVLYDHPDEPTYDVTCWLSGLLAEKFPKYVKAKDWDGAPVYDDTGACAARRPVTTFRVRLSSRTNNPTNEGGLRRLRAFLKVCADLGLPLTDMYAEGDSSTGCSLRRLADAVLPGCALPVLVLKERA